MTTTTERPTREEMLADQIVKAMATSEDPRRTVLQILHDAEVNSAFNALDSLNGNWVTGRW